MSNLDWDDVEYSYGLAVRASRSIVVHAAYEEAWQAAIDGVWLAIDGVATARAQEQKARADADKALELAKQATATHERWRR